MNEDISPQPAKRLGPTAYLLAAIPVFAVSFGVCFANRDEPVLFGFPFLLTYFIFWICATPLFLWLADRGARQWVRSQRSRSWARFPWGQWLSGFSLWERSK